jgi:hypothetical protein
VPREKHQDGWVEVAGKKTKKWIGHWMPYRAGGRRTHARVVLGEKAKMTKWQAEDALREHIARETQRAIRCPEGDPTLQQFWERSYLPSRTWGPPMKGVVPSVIEHHLPSQFGLTNSGSLHSQMFAQCLRSKAVRASGLTRNAVPLFCRCLEPQLNANQRVGDNTSK